MHIIQEVKLKLFEAPAKESRFAIKILLLFVSRTCNPSCNYVIGLHYLIGLVYVANFYQTLPFFTGPQERSFKWPGSLPFMDKFLLVQNLQHNVDLFSLSLACFDVSMASNINK